MIRSTDDNLFADGRHTTDADRYLHRGYDLDVEAGEN